MQRWNELNDRQKRVAADMVKEQLADRALGTMLPVFNDRELDAQLKGFRDMHDMARRSDAYDMRWARAQFITTFAPHVVKRAQQITESAWYPDPDDEIIIPGVAGPNPLDD